MARVVVPCARGQSLTKAIQLKRWLFLAALIVYFVPAPLAVAQASIDDLDNVQDDPSYHISFSELPSCNQTEAEWLLGNISAPLVPPPAALDHNCTAFTPGENVTLYTERLAQSCQLNVSSQQVQVSTPAFMVRTRLQMSANPYTFDVGVVAGRVAVAVLESVGPAQLILMLLPCLQLNFLTNRIQLTYPGK